MPPYKATNPFKTGWNCVCPRCAEGRIFDGRIGSEVKDRCPVCGLNLKKNDSADGPAVFLIFVLGFSIVPLALLIDYLYQWPLWLHALIWSIVCLVICLGALRPIKAFVIAQQFKYRPRDWEE